MSSTANGSTMVKCLTKHSGPLSGPLLSAFIFLAIQRVSCSIYPFPAWGSPYQTADHFWPLQNITGGLLEDVQGAAHTIVYNGGKIRRVDQLGSSLYLDGKDDWVDTGNFRECSELHEITYGCGFNADCVTDPSRCKEGFTLGFWLKVYGSGYIMSSGSFTNSKRGPGFRLVYDTKIRGFEFVLETETKRWRVHVQGEVKKWIHMIFSWKETNGIEYYEDGNLSTYNNKPFFLAPRPKKYTPVITLARPNNVMEVRNFGFFEISQFAIWMKWLSNIDAGGVYLNSVVYDQDTAVCCYFKSVGLCTVNACYDQKQCKRIDETHKCLCPRVSMQLQTCKAKIKGYCGDQIKSCKLYARQPKYCQHRKMREVCPRSCSYCAPGSTTKKIGGLNTNGLSSSVQSISPDTQKKSGSGLFLSTDLLNLESSSTWPNSITPTLHPSSSSYVPYVMPSSSMPVYGNITTRQMPRGKNCESLECLYYSHCKMHEDFAECQCKTTCSFQYAPVCGTNSKTYLNKCVLKTESCLLGRWTRVARKGTCGSRYPRAVHYWPFNSTSNSKTLLDVRGKCKTLTYNGVHTTYAEQLGPVVSLDGSDDWIFISGVRSKCINDPTLCSNGLTVAFWLKYHAGEFILSGGRYTDHPKGPGFRFICLGCAKNSNDKLTKRFVLDLSTQTQDWKITLDFLPKAWFHFAFTWHLDHGLKVYKNGKLVVKDTVAESVKFKPLDPRYETITLGRPNSLSKLHNYGKFDIGHLVIWLYELSPYEVEVAFLTVLAKTTKSLICCHFKKADPCMMNPCYNGASCRSIDEKFECICPDITQGRCEKQTQISPCIDRSDDCAMFASQSGYCQYHKRSMTSICAKSCKFCSIGSRTVVLQLAAASKTQSQRMLSPTPTPYPTIAQPHLCYFGMGSKQCICMNCDRNNAHGFECCIDVLDKAAIEEGGVALQLSSTTVSEFLAKIPALRQLLKDIVSDHCSKTTCFQASNAKRKRRNINYNDRRDTQTPRAKQDIRSWDGSPITPSNTIEPGGSLKNNPQSTTSTPSLRKPIDVSVIVFKIAPDASHYNRLATALFVSVTSLVNGQNYTHIIKAGSLARLVRVKRELFKKRLNITIDSVTDWTSWRGTGPIGPRMVDSTLPGFTSSLELATMPGAGPPNVYGQEGRNTTTTMSQSTFIIVLVTGIGGFVVLAIIIIYMLVKFLRRMKGEFVPDKVYPNEQKSNSGSDQLIPSFVDPSTPRITDVPKKTVRSAGSSGSAGGSGVSGPKKQKKPMGVKVTYKPPKWD